MPFEMELIPYEEISVLPVSYAVGRILQQESQIMNIADARGYYLHGILHGTGVEFGIACYPMPVPLDCTVRYADLFTPEEGCNADMHGDSVPVTYFTSFENMEGIPANSQDFILSSHVIEHTADPIRAIRSAWEKLTPGGVLFMAIPHMKYTFDRKRRLTSRNHMIEDYVNPMKTRDAEHVVDFIQRVVDPGCDCTALVERFLQGEKHDVHWHTFTEKSFSRLMKWIDRNVCRWSRIEVLPRLSFEGANEFYLRAVK